MDLYREAYLHWKSQYKLLMRVFSEDQVFKCGFEAADKVTEAMQTVIEDLQSQVKELNERVAKLTKPAKAAKSE